MGKNNDFEFDAVSVINNNELVEIDALLRKTADISTAEIDFTAIKARAVKADSRHKSKRRRLWRYAIASAACMLMCLGVISLANKFSSRPPKDVDILNSDSPQASDNSAESYLPVESGAAITPEPFSKIIPASYTSCSFVGVLSPSKTETLTELFPEELPKYMKKQVDNAKRRSIAKGTDVNGIKKYFDCTILTSAPYNLQPGEVGEFSNDSDCVFYWQVAEDRCLCVRFFGFTVNESRKMFTGFSNGISK